LRAIEEGLRGAFAAYGYREIATPVLEFADVLETAIDQQLGDVYRLFDDAGRVMVLRPDITVPVSRLIATRMADHPGPVRVFYFGRAFRPPPHGSPRASEVRQAGAELVGASGPAADAELIAVLHRSLTAAGIGELTIAIGDIALTEAILDGMGIPRRMRARLGRALAARNLVQWQEIAAEIDVPSPARELLNELPAQRGGRDVLNRVCEVTPGADQACTRVGELLILLERYGIAADVMLDVGIARDWPYYSGLVLEAHSANVGAPLAVGGRYDRLAEHFGTPRPAVGFAVDLDVLNRSLTLQNTNGDREDSGVVVVGGMDRHLAAAEGLRARGVPIACIPSEQADPFAFAARDGWRYVVEQDGSGFRVTDTRDGSVRWVGSVEEVAT
jgi:ATP phosphoribosyltransferase regulatory subunit